jgi:hypothetical protein
MFNPVVIPLPLALIFVVLLAVALYTLDRTLRTEVWNPWAGQTWAAPTGGRHRPESIPEADRRDWAYIVAMRMSESVQRQHQERPTLVAELSAGIERIRELDGNAMWSLDAQPEIEATPAPLQIEAAGLPDREPIEPGPLHVAGDIEWDTRELAAVQ